MIKFHVYKLKVDFSLFFSSFCRPEFSTMFLQESGALDWKDPNNGCDSCDPCILCPSSSCPRIAAVSFFLDSVWVHRFCGSTAVNAAMLQQLCRTTFPGQTAVHICHWSFVSAAASASCDNRIQATSHSRLSTSLRKNMLTPRWHLDELSLYHSQI